MTDCPILTTIAQSDLITVNNQHLLLIDNYARVSGTVVNLSCNTGYALSSTTSTVTCQTSGVWSPTVPTCQSTTTTTSALSEEGKIVVAVTTVLAIIVICVLAVIVYHVWLRRRWGRGGYTEKRRRYVENDRDRGYGDRNSNYRRGSYSESVGEQNYTREVKEVRRPYNEAYYSRNQSNTGDNYYTRQSRRDTRAVSEPDYNRETRVSTRRPFSDYGNYRKDVKEIYTSKLEPGTHAPKQYGSGGQRTTSYRDDYVSTRRDEVVPYRRNSVGGEQVIEERSYYSPPYQPSIVQDLYGVPSRGGYHYQPTSRVLATRQDVPQHLVSPYYAPPADKKALVTRESRGHPPAYNDGDSPKHGLFLGEWLDRHSIKGLKDFNRRALLHGRDPFLWKPVGNNWGFDLKSHEM